MHILQLCCSSLTGIRVMLSWPHRGRLTKPVRHISENKGNDYCCPTPCICNTNTSPSTTNNHKWFWLSLLVISRHTSVECPHSLLLLFLESFLLFIFFCFCFWHDLTIVICDGFSFGNFCFLSWRNPNIKICLILVFMFNFICMQSSA